MSKVVYSLSASLDGYVAGPGDGPEHGLGLRGGERIFEWYWSGDEQIGDTGLFSPEGPNRGVVERMMAESGAMISGRRTWDITDGWGGTHPFPGMKGIVLLTHRPPAELPKGAAEIRVVTSGIEEAVAVAKELAGDKTVSFAGASAGKQALAAGLVDEILVNVAPLLLGGGVRMFDELPDAIALEPIETIAAPHATHLRYRVLR